MSDNASSNGFWLIFWILVIIGVTGCEAKSVLYHHECYKRGGHVIELSGNDPFDRTHKCIIEDNNEQ